ncbi:MAG: hypothetical protein IPK58_19330 [Acidobacteria bacterium]|nr:hypothetical protein [Acidobacteriota bacterium]
MKEPISTNRNSLRLVLIAIVLTVTGGLAAGIVFIGRPDTETENSAGTMTAPIERPAIPESPNTEKEVAGVSDPDPARTSGSTVAPKKGSRTRTPRTGD